MLLQTIITTPTPLEVIGNSEGEGGFEEPSF